MRFNLSTIRLIPVLVTAAVGCWAACGPSLFIGNWLLPSACAADAEPATLTLKVGDLERTALIYAPPASASAESGSQPRPLVFVFHGHGGTATNSAKSFGIQLLWPEAIVVYPQGVPTPGRLTDPEGKRNGWQHAVGDQEDRDLKFFDALLAKLKADDRIDNQRIYSMGHSNGGAFTLLLWANRGEVFAAVGPSGASMSRSMKFKPLPVIELAGENDSLVKYAWQQATMEAIKKINGCEQAGKPAGEFCTEYPSPSGTPFVSYIHPGGHKYPPEASKAFVEFFKAHAKPAASGGSSEKPADKAAQAE
ncbi:MAG TPA: PHB depolymerase family esterase [Pirellulales bacterium]|jgi:polyhydroxybutyrate depolymerase|nr:PHB depolymerase family esterase [Pirellulales bacterium]